jgi:hypothetical protein
MYPENQITQHTEQNLAQAPVSKTVVNFPLSFGKTVSFDGKVKLMRKTAITIRGRLLKGVKIQDGDVVNPEQLAENEQYVKNELIKVFYNLTEEDLDQMTEEEFQTLFEPLEVLDPLRLEADAKKARMKRRLASDI